MQNELLTVPKEAHGRTGSYNWRALILRQTLKSHDDLKAVVAKDCHFSIRFQSEFMHLTYKV